MLFSNKAVPENLEFLTNDIQILDKGNLIRAENDIKIVDKIDKIEITAEKFDYNNSSKKFELSKFEDEIIKSMLSKISEEIVLSLYSIQ